MSVKRELNDAEIRKYCLSGGVKCPYCASDELEGSQVDFSDIGIDDPLKIGTHSLGLKKPM